MEYSKPIISICIPTNGATKWVIPTLKGIYSQGVDLSLFDVVIADNGENSDLKEELKQFDYSNLSYNKTDNKGFLNLITSLKLGNGIYHKMLNHRSILEPNALKDWISLVEKYRLTKPVIYCSNGSITNGEITECKNLDEFVFNLHYMCTWSGGIGIWDNDIESLNEIKYNEMFPNTSLLFEHRQHSNYIIYNKKFEVQQCGQGKGKYNLFNTFAVVFPDMLNDLLLRGRITSRTYNKVLEDLYRCLQDFYMQFVLKSLDKSFDLTGIHKSLTTYYSERDYWRMMYYCHKIYYYEKIMSILTCTKRKILGWKQNN
jgi:hypothetical protein